MTMNEALDYFKGDALASGTWGDKYCMKDQKGHPLESTPAEMHYREAKEFGRIEAEYAITESIVDTHNLSEFGKNLHHKRLHQTEQEIVNEVFSYFDKFEKIIPQGSIMSNLGNTYQFGSLSNCFGIAPPYDSYGGIFKTDQEIAQLEKRRGGVGAVLDTLRPVNSFVSNAARSSTGVVSFAERFSNTTREVAQGGRRGALMLLLSVKHPEIFDFVKMKDDRTKVTGANVSVKFTNKFMQAVEFDGDFFCTFPTDIVLTQNASDFIPLEYNKIFKVNSEVQGDFEVMRIKAKELFDLVGEMAWKNGEPGVAFEDRIMDYSPDGVYDVYAPKVCNPCAEQWFSHDETCRLIAMNFFTCIDNPFTSEASLNIDKIYENAYIQQRLGDDLVDLEVEHIDRIIKKIMTDPEPEDVKALELNLWVRIRIKAEQGRRTGGGFTGLADALAALGVGYGTEEGRNYVEVMMKTKMMAELDATIDMSILRGPFTGWNKDKEWLPLDKGETYPANSFYKMIEEEFPLQAQKMHTFGRRNVSWSTVAPTGTVSLMTQTTSGLEPLFKAFYIRRKKIVPGVSGTRVDFVDQNGDSWQEFAVLHPKFKDWIKAQEGFDIEDEYVTGSEAHTNVEHNPAMAKYLFKLSPWFGSQAEDIAVEDRIKFNTIVQKYTSNAISCTVNFNKDATVDQIKDVYMMAWKAGLKGITVYRDGCRSGVLVNETAAAVINEFGYTDAVKRPKELQAQYHYVQSGGKKYAIIVGLLDSKPYELFVHKDPIVEGPLDGTITKIKKGVYQFDSNTCTIDHLEITSRQTDERLLTVMCSQLLRHGVDPKEIIKQVNKAEVNVISFAKAITRVLKKYVAEDNLVGGDSCSNCGEVGTIIYQEGCQRCTNCGSSKC